jgi:FlaA1/EpsC-like NDP-sugar epimerase
MRNRFFLLIDIAAIGIAALAAFVLRFDLRFAAYRDEFRFFVIASLLIKPTVLYLAGMYRRYWGYASVSDLVTLLSATTAASAAMGVAMVAGLWSGSLPAFSRSVLVIDWLLTTCAIGAIRVCARIVTEQHRKRRASDGPVKRVLIAGAGDAGVIVARDLARNAQLAMEPIGFLDDDPMKIGKEIAGLPVLGSLKHLARTASAHCIDQVVIAMPTAPGKVIRSVVDQCRALSLDSMVVPGVFELVGGQVTVGRLREVRITDLLRRSHARPAVAVDPFIAGRTVLVTGAGGSIGREICKQVCLLRPKLLVMVGHGENSLFEVATDLRRAHPEAAILTLLVDIRDERRLNRIFTTLTPDVVFHAAAHKHVPLMEENPEEALSNNAVGTRNVIRAALAADTGRLVMISTDKAAAPVSVMGASKRLAEELVRQSATRFGRAFMVVRFGNVLGSRGSAVPIFQRQIEQGGPVTITHPEMSRYFMTIPEAAHLVLEAAAMGHGGELFVLRMGEPVRIVDLARDMIRLSGADGDVPVIFTGIRPGEKIEEILWEDGSTIEPTIHPDIIRVQEQPLLGDVDWAAAVEHLSAMAAQGARGQLFAELSRYLPTFSRPDAGPRVGV